ncbi:MAG: hypothetical protein N2319_11515 [Candidatus Kapabacteria bacterium]|nr:hypothetical protein [Candidatus Kapabacteria bacterium]
MSVLAIGWDGLSKLNSHYFQVEGKRKSFLIVLSGLTDTSVCAKKDVLHLKGVGHLKKIIVALHFIQSDKK